MTQSPTQKQSQQDTADSIASDCQLVAGAVATGAAWSFLFGGPAGPIFAGIFATGGVVVTITCSAVYSQQTSALQQKINDCEFVSMKLSNGIPVTYKGCP